MFSIGEYVVYGVEGVCRVLDPAYTFYAINHRFPD